MEALFIHTRSVPSVRLVPIRSSFLHLNRPTLRIHSITSHSLLYVPHPTATLGYRPIRPCKDGPGTVPAKVVQAGWNVAFCSPQINPRYSLPDYPQHPALRESGREREREESDRRVFSGGVVAASGFLTPCTHSSAYRSVLGVDLTQTNLLGSLFLTIHTPYPQTRAPDGFDTCDHDIDCCSLPAIPPHPDFGTCTAASHGTPRRLRQCLRTSSLVTTAHILRRALSPSISRRLVVVSSTPDRAQGAAKMRLPYRLAAVVCDIVLLFATRVAAVDSPSTEALWVQPSTTWYGIDGTWSNFGFAAGSPGQIVYLTVATTLSEIWLIDSGGCPPVQLCTNARGGVFDIGASQSWRDMGPWQLGMNHTGMEGNGRYGLETISFANTIAQETTTVNGALVSVLNDTNYYQGYIGVGVTQGRFGNNITNPFISQLSESYGYIPSHSYGYTAGAYYRDTGTSNGTFASLTLGGYDKLRFVPHDTQFSLDPETRLPNVRLRGVTAHVKSLDKAPGNWTSTSETLVEMNDGIVALIDSSTPYLWLPTEVCDRFATALNLTWREDLGLYVFPEGSHYMNYQNDDSLSFTFSVSSYDNTDNFGLPLDLPGVVNITLPSAAFAQLLRYPFKNVIQWGDSSIPYFPLKRSTREVNGNQYIIGRTFMQEAYIITNYDRGQFSLHQALFPENSASNYTLQAIERPPDSPYPAFVPSGGSGDGGLTPGKTAGIVLSAFASGSVIGVILWFCCRKRLRSKKNKHEETGEAKEESRSEEDDPPQSPVKRMFTIMVGKKRSRKTLKPEEQQKDQGGIPTEPVEVGADEQHQVFELPVPPEPVELDSHDIGDDDTDLGHSDSNGLSEYEITRRKLERQLQGPVPTYSPTATPMTTERVKSMQDVSPVAHYRPSDEPSPASSPTYANTNSLPDSLPSPLSPHPDWATRHFDLPSPMTVAPTSFHPHRATSNSDLNSSYSPVSPHSSSQFPQTYAPSSISRTDSNNVSPTSPVGSVGSFRSLRTSPSYQRTPIDPTRVVCLGPLPENVELPLQRAPIPRIFAPDGRVVNPNLPVVQRQVESPVTGSLKHSNSNGRGSNETLGSNYTVEEENRLQTDGLSSPGIRPSHGTDDSQDFPRSPHSMERIEAGSELVHVPQVAEKRYSWEENDDRR